MSTLLSAAGVALLGAITVAALVLGDGDLVVALAPLLVASLLYALWKLPLRYPVLVLAFLALTLENPSDAPAAGLWKSSLYPLGKLLLAHLNLTFPAQHWMAFSGLDLVLVGLFAIALTRRSRERGPASAGPMRLFAFVCLGGAAWMWIWGMARGGADVASSLWQVQRVVYLPLFLVLFQLALSGAADRVALGKVVVAAACIKAALAIYLHATLAPPPGATTLDYATTHADSMLFASAFCLLATLLVQRLDGRRALLGAIVLPLLLAGMIANHRRIVWVELAAGLAVLYALSPWTRVKRAIARTVVIAAPLVLVYAAVGWGHNTGIFAPLDTVRSVVDSDADASTAWRDWENYNLFFTLRQNPLLGTGYGHGYIEIVKLPDISQAYELYRFIPHNSILGLLTYGGLVGFAALWSVPVVGLFLAARAARFAVSPLDRTAAIAATATVVVYLVHCYGDMGLGTWTSVFLVAPALAIASRLAVATGAWPRSGRHRPAQPELVISIAPAAQAPHATPPAQEVA